MRLSWLPVGIVKIPEIPGINKRNVMILTKTGCPC
jgi:hypothetical protein